MADAEKLLDKVRELCLRLPEVVETTSMKNPIFRANKKTFAAFWPEDSGHCLHLRISQQEQQSLLQDKRFGIPPFCDKQTPWVSVQLTGKVPWKRIAVLVEGSFRLVANKRMLAALGAKG